MKILVLTDRFFPEITAPSVRIMDHAREWIELGHEVTVVTCAPNFPRGELFEGYSNKVYQEEWIDGVRTVRVWSYMTANEGFLKRIIDYVSFMLASALLCFRYPAFDVVLATSPPLFTAAAGYMVSKLRRRPWVFEIRDLWPASIKAVGVSDGWIIRVFERLELFLYRKADRIISLTQPFKNDLIARGIPGEKNDVVTNGVDTTRFSHEKVLLDARANLGIDEDIFLAGYVGTTGMAHGLETVLDAAELSRDAQNIRYLILGEGAERASLEKSARERGLTNLLFHDFVPHSEMPSYLAALNASLVHLRADPLFETVIPSKIFEAMAMGTPIVSAVAGECSRIVGSTDSGVCIASGDAHAMAEAVRELASDPARCRLLSKNGVRAARDLYSRRAGAEAALRALGRACELATGKEAS